MPPRADIPEGGTTTEENMADQTEVNGLYWQEQMYHNMSQYDKDSKFFENSQKSAHIEGKMSAREMTFAKGGGLPTVMPLPAGMGTTRA